MEGGPRLETERKISGIRSAYPTPNPIWWHRRYWRAHRDDRTPPWSIWMWATVEPHHLHRICAEQFCHRIHSKLPPPMPVRMRNGQSLNGKLDECDQCDGKITKNQWSRKRFAIAVRTSASKTWQNSAYTYWVISENVAHTWIASTRRPSPITIMPALARAFVMLAPMPALEPVTNATFPCHLSILLSAVCVCVQWVFLASLNFAMHLLRTHVIRNECFCGFSVASWLLLLFIASVTCVDKIAMLFSQLNVWKKTNRCDGLVRVLYSVASHWHWLL